MIANSNVLYTRLLTLLVVSSLISSIIVNGKNLHGPIALVKKLDLLFVVPIYNVSSNSSSERQKRHLEFIWPSQTYRPPSPWPPITEIPRNNLDQTFDGLVGKNMPVWIYSSSGSEVHFRKEYPFRNGIPETTGTTTPYPIDIRLHSSPKHNPNTYTWDFNKWPIDNLKNIYDEVASNDEWSNSWNNYRYINRRSIGNQWFYAEPIVLPIKSPNVFNWKPLELDVIYVEILVLVDNTLVQKFPSKENLYHYLINLWSRVKEVYKPLRNPEYRIILAGFVIADDDDAFSFITENSRNLGMPIRLEYQRALNGSSRWLYSQREAIPLTSYDVAIIHTSKQSAEIINNYVHPNNVLGIAKLKGACQDNHYEQVVHKVGLVYDDGEYTNIAPVAHELAHTLGVNHDDGECLGGYLMTPSARPRSPTQYQFSQCSLNQLNEFLRLSPTCLNNVTQHG